MKKKIIYLSKKAVIGLSFEMLLPLILGIVIVVIYMVVFGPQVLAQWFNQSVNVSVSPTP